MNKKVFRAQALAIVMLILVIASIIGVSLFSRMAKDKDIAVNEQDSAIAAAEVDAILDFFVGADIEQIESVLGESEDSSSTYYLNSSQNTLIPALINDYQVIDNEDEAKTIIDWCSTDNNENQGSVEVVVSLAEEDDYTEVQPGNGLFFNLENLDLGGASTCSMRVSLQVLDENSIFLLKKVIDDGNSVSESKVNYCIGSCDGPFTDVEASPGVITTIPNPYIDLDLVGELNNNVVEIRILPIKGVLKFHNAAPTCDTNKNYQPLKVSAEATCADVTRGEEMFLPGSGLLGYSALFDYGIYDNGSFQP